MGGVNNIRRWTLDFVFSSKHPKRGLWIKAPGIPRKLKVGITNISPRPVPMMSCQFYMWNLLCGINRKKRSKGNSKLKAAHDAGWSFTKSKKRKKERKRDDEHHANNSTSANLCTLTRTEQPKRSLNRCGETSEVVRNRSA